MSIEIINPNDEQHWLECRTKDITSTEISALFGFSPYMTAFELWHRKKAGDVVKLEENERMKWGTALQDAIAGEIAKEHDWKIRRMNEYIRDPELRAGASFDFSIDQHGPTREVFNGLLEIKNVDSLQFKNGWKEDTDGNLEAPLHIEIQVQHQLMVSGRSFAYIGALVGGNRLVLIKRELNQAVCLRIIHAIAHFWQTIEMDQPPEPNFIKDAEFIAKLYNYSEPGKVIDVTDNDQFMNLAREHKRVSEIIKDAEEQKDALKAQMLTLMGDAEKAEGGEFSISAGLITDTVKMVTDLTPAQLAGREPISSRKGYRNFRPYWRKAK